MDFKYSFDLAMPRTGELSLMYLFGGKLFEEERHMKAAQAWQAALGQLQMEMPKAAYDTWVRDAELLSYEDGSFIIGVHMRSAPQ